MPSIGPPWEGTHLGDSRCIDIPPLLGHTVGITGDRRSDELAGHLRALGAEIVQGAVLRVRPLAHDDRRLWRATRALLADPPDHLLATTGIGMRRWIDAATAWRARGDLLRMLSQTRILARGPKVVGALSEVGLTACHVATPSNTVRMVDHLLATTSLHGSHVAIQLPADRMHDVVARLEAEGARVSPVAVYELALPGDREPGRRVARAIASRRVSAVTFTSRAAVRHLVALAVEEGLGQAVVDALRTSVTPVCIGATTSEAIRALIGVAPSCPQQSVLGALAPAVADEARRRGHRHIRLPDGKDVVVQRRFVDADGIVTMMSDREASLLDQLTRLPRRTVSRGQLMRTVWKGEPVDASSLDVTMSRLRRRIHGTGLEVLTVPGRGYLINGDPDLCGAPAGGRAALPGHELVQPA